MLYDAVLFGVTDVGASHVPTLYAVLPICTVASQIYNSNIFVDIVIINIINL